MDTSEKYYVPTIRLGEFAFKTGIFAYQRPWIEDDCFLQAKLVIVRACVDAIPRNRNRVFLAKRKVESGTARENPNWWYIGGGMIVGDDTILGALQRVLQRELRLDSLSADKLTFLCHFNLQWPSSQDLSLLYLLELSDDEAEGIMHTLDTKVEYERGHWFTYNEVINQPEIFHPALVQVCEILSSQH